LGSGSPYRGCRRKLIRFYFATGDADFMLITEGETESIIASMLAAAAAA
jgi:hypothetical protein